MIFAHTLIGMLPAEQSGFSLAWFLGSVVPDLDHLYVLAKNRIWKPAQAVAAMKYEDRYKLRFKTPLMHSLVGALLLSAPVYFFDNFSGLLFLFGYLLHLFLDWFDSDEKRYFFPLPHTTRGFLPIFSTTEKIFTLILAFLVGVCYL